MKKYISILLTALIGSEAALILRTAQNSSGFTPDGLPVPGNLYGRLLPAALILLAAALICICRQLPAEGARTPLPFTDYFQGRSDAAPTLMLTGIFLWVSSGILEAISFLVSTHFTAEFSLFLTDSTLPPQMAVLSGAMTIIAALALTPLIFACRTGGKRMDPQPAHPPVDSNLMLLPVGAMVVRLVLLYREKSVIPTISSYYIELLALIMLILSLYRTASFAFHCGSTRLFVIYDGLALTLLIATLADDHPPIYILLYLGGALLTLGLLLMRLDALAASQHKKHSEA